MSVFSHRYEERLCRLCRGYDVTYRDGHIVLYQVAIRSYAHPQCMVEAFGVAGALAKVRHEWQKKEFKKALKHPIKKGGEHPMMADLKKVMR